MHRRTKVVSKVKKTNKKLKITNVDAKRINKKTVVNNKKVPKKVPKSIKKVPKAKVLKKVPKSVKKVPKTKVIKKAPKSIKKTPKVKVPEKIKKVPKKVKTVKKVPIAKTPKKIKKVPKVKVPKLKTRKIPLKKKKRKKKKKLRIAKVYYQLTCLLSNKTCRYSHERAVKLMHKLKFSTVEELCNNYISRDVCKLLKTGHTESEIRLKYNNQNVVEVPFAIIKKYIKTFFTSEQMLRRRRRKVVNDVINDKELINKSIRAEYAPVKVDLNKPECVADMTHNVCLRPDIFLNNDRFCNYCSFFENCACNLKKWNKKIDVKRNKRFK